MPNSALQALLSISQIDLRKDRNHILKEILTVVGHQIGGHSGSMMLVNEENGELEMVATVGLPDDYIDQVYARGVPITCSPSGMALETGESYVVSNIFKEPRDKWWADLARELGFSAQLFMPIKHKGKVIGLLNIYMAEPHEYTHNEITFVSIAASQAAAVIENARLYATVSKEKTELESEVSEHKRVEELLWESKEIVSNILSASPIGIGIVKDRKLGWTNRRMLEMMGFKPDDAPHDYVGLSAEVIYASKEEYERAGRLFYEELNKGAKVVETDAKLKRKDGSLFDGHIKMSFLDPSNPKKGAVATISDISWRKQAEEQLRTSEEKFRTFMETARDLMYIVDKGCNFTYVNGSMATTLGYSKEKLLGMHVTQILTTKTLSESFESRWNTIVTKGELTLDAVWITKDGKEICGELKVVAIYDEDGTFAGGRAVFHDITERKRMEEELQRSEALYRTLFEATGVPTVILDGDGTFYRVNEEGANISGFTKEELEGKKSWTEFIAKKEDLEMMKEIHRLRRTDPDKVPKNYEFLFKDRYGNLRNIFVTAAMIPGTERSVVSFADLTERKKAEKALQDSEEYFRSLIENALDGVMIVDERGNLQYQSPSVEHILGYKREERVGMSLYDNIHPEDKLRSTEAFSQLLHEKGLIKKLDLCVKHKDGSWRTISGRAKNLLDNPAVRGVVVNFRDITDRNRAEEALREEEKEHQTILNSLPLGVYHIDSNGRFVHVNDVLDSWYGLKAEEFKGKTSGELFPKEAEKYVKSDKKVLERGKPHIGATGKVITPLGVRWVRLDKVPVRDADGNVTGIIGFDLDVTEQRQAEEALRVKDFVIASSINAIAIADLEGRLTHVNPSFIELWGYDSTEEVLGKSVLDFWETEKQALEIVKLLRTQNSSKGSWTGELIATRKDGSTFDALVTASTVYNNVGKPVGLTASFIDITERRKIEQKLQDSEKWYHTLIHSSSDIIFVLDKDGTVRYMSSAVERILGYKPEEMFGKNGFSYYHPDDVSALQAAFVGLTQQEAGTTATAVSRAVHKDGSVVYLEVIGENLLEDPQIRGVVGTCRDVTERKRVEIVLRESEERLSQIVQGSQIPSFVIDKNHRVTHWNKACERLTNISAAEMVGTNKQWSIFYPKERQIMADFVVDNLPEDVLTSTYGTICRTSNLVEGAYEGLDFFPAFGDSGKWLLFTAAPLKDSNGNTVGALETFLDLTKLKRAEEQIKTSLQEKELLLQEIHHRVKNNMQVISSLLNLQSRRITDEEALAMFIDTQSRVKSMALVHEKLYQSKDIAHINFADYIRSLTTNLFQSYREKQTGIKLTTDVGTVLLDLPTAIPCGLVINELTANALKHAFPNGKKGDIHIALHLVAGDDLELIVSDNGIGFPEAVDFRNPETLGLQLVNSLVESQLNGTIELDRNRGTTFKINFQNERGHKEQV